MQIAVPTAGKDPLLSSRFHVASRDALTPTNVATVSRVSPAYHRVN